MKVLKITLAALIALAMFSCKTDPVDNGKTVKETKMTVLIPGIANTRAEAGTAPGNDTNKYYSEIGENLALFAFDSPNANIVGAPHIIDVAQDLVDTNPVADHQKQTTITTMTSAAEVVVVANYPDGTDFSGVTSKASLYAMLFDMADLAVVSDATPANDNLHGMRYAMMYNADVASNGTVSTDTGGGPGGEDILRATVQIQPAYARIEIVGIDGSYEIPESSLGAGDEIPSAIESFTLTGVYLNRIHSSLRFDGVVTEGTFVDVASETAVPTWAKDEYDATRYAGADKYLNVKKELTEGNGDWTDNAAYRWAYNIAPVKGVIDATATEPVVNVPNIIFALDDMVYKTGYVQPADIRHYIKVSNYTDGTNPVTEFKRGFVYRVSTVLFNQTNNKNVFNPEDIDLIATLQILPWEYQPLTPVVD